MRNFHAEGYQQLAQIYSSITLIPRNASKVRGSSAEERWKPVMSHFSGNGNAKMQFQYSIKLCVTFAVAASADDDDNDDDYYWYKLVEANSRQFAYMNCE